MHLIALNNSELWLGLWRGTIACDPKDSIDTWDWAVLTGDTWIAHGAEVAEAARLVPSPREASTWISDS